MSASDPIWCVRKRLNRFLEVRGIDITKETKEPTSDNVIGYIQKAGVYTVEGTYRDKTTVAFAIMSPTHSNIYKSADFKKMLSRLPHDEVYVIVDSVEKRKSVLSIIEKERKSDQLVRLLEFATITSVCVDHESYQPTRVVYRDGWLGEDCLSALRLKNSNMACISYNDVAVIWAGGRKGDIVEIRRVSNTVCHSTVYKQVI